MFLKVEHCWWVDVLVDFCWGGFGEVLGCSGMQSFVSLTFSVALSGLCMYDHFKVIAVVLSEMWIVLLQARNSNFRHRPIGVGVQGLADAFIFMRFPFDSEQAQQLNKQIFEHLYYAALDASCELAERDGPYETYDGSPVSKGVSSACVLGGNVSHVSRVNYELSQLCAPMCVIMLCATFGVGIFCATIGVGVLYTPLPL